jgi:hypothetical protein
MHLVPVLGKAMDGTVPVTRGARFPTQSRPSARTGSVLKTTRVCCNSDRRAGPVPVNWAAQKTGIAPRLCWRPKPNLPAMRNARFKG